MKLNRTGSNWTELERGKINENWDIIEGSYNDVVGQITDEVVGHLIDSAKLIWKEPVDTVEDLPANAEVGETRMVREADPDGISYVYRYDGEEWEKIQAIDVTLVNEVDRRLTAQLAETEQALQFKNNAPLPIPIPTYEGSGQTVHPDALYFPNRWNGYRYWMVHTPYPNTDDKYENPSIAVSNDGITWVDVPGLTNPIDQPTEEELSQNVHLSDGVIFIVGNTMECWYRYRNKTTNEEKFLRRTTTDGINWTPKEVVYQFT